VCVNLLQRGVAKDGGDTEKIHPGMISGHENSKGVLLIDMVNSDDTLPLDQPLRTVHLHRDLDRSLTRQESQGKPCSCGVGGIDNRD
jgi:hypothetical protein